MHVHFQYLRSPLLVLVLPYSMRSHGAHLYFNLYKHKKNMNVALMFQTAGINKA